MPTCAYAPVFDACAVSRQRQQGHKRHQQHRRPPPPPPTTAAAHHHHHQHYHRRLATTTTTTTTTTTAAAAAATASAPPPPLPTSSIVRLRHPRYSWRYAVGGRTGVWPESRVSLFGELLRLDAFRRASLPSLPLFVTEFGWDSAGGGEDCGMPECVSEVAQARYLVRALLMLSAVPGVERASVFFYANTGDDDDSIGGAPAGLQVFSRSGLTGSAKTGFERKQSLRALETLVATAGDMVFHRAVQRGDDAWAFL
jgi:hypothetical protein